VDKQLPLTENTFRYGSQSFLNLWSEARYLYLREIIHVNDDDKEILLETNLGEYGIYESVEFEGEEYDIIGRDGDWVYLRSIYDTMTGKKEIKVKEKDIKILEEKVPLDLPMLEEDELEEAEDKKTPPIGKPKRGGSKKFYVYVKDKGKIKKVSFGDTTGLSTKINNPEARRAFAARHKCGTGEPRTSARYWSCRIGRYWKQLGGAKNFSGFW
jgi:hypothetical protein